MWAPADLFGPGLSALTFLAKGVLSFFYEHPMVLTAVVLLVAGLIAVVAMLANRGNERA